MVISFRIEADILVYTLEKQIRHCQTFHNLFAAQCVRRLSYLVGLQSHLVTDIDNWRTQSFILNLIDTSYIDSHSHVRGIFPTPRDIWRQSFNPDTLRIRLLTKSSN